MLCPVYNNSATKNLLHHFQISLSPCQDMRCDVVSDRRGPFVPVQALFSDVGAVVSSRGRRPLERQRDAAALAGIEQHAAERHRHRHRHLVRSNGKPTVRQRLVETSLNDERQKRSPPTPSRAAERGARFAPCHGQGGVASERVRAVCAFVRRYRDSQLDWIMQAGRGSLRASLQA